MKKTHYTFGYGGNFNYNAVCGKEIHSHSETDSASIDPNNVNCKKCKDTSEWKEDYIEKNNVKCAIRRRIYLESDILHASELRSAQRSVMRLCASKKLKYVRRVFSDVLDFAWRDLDKTWQAVKLADEIYSDSSLMPLVRNMYMGAPLIFNKMCEKAIAENIIGKDVYILNNMKNIHWDMIDISIMKKAFKANDLFMYNDEMDIVKVDVTKIVKQP